MIWMDENTVLPERTRHTGVHDLHPGISLSPAHPGQSLELGNPGIPSLRLETSAQAWARAECGRQRRQPQSVWLKVPNLGCTLESSRKLHENTIPGIWPRPIKSTLRRWGLKSRTFFKALSYPSEQTELRTTGLHQRQGSGLGTKEALILSGDVPAQWFSNVFHRDLGFCKDISEL